MSLFPRRLRRELEELSYEVSKKKFFYREFRDDTHRLSTRRLSGAVVVFPSDVYAALFFAVAAGHVLDALSLVKYFQIRIMVNQNGPFLPGIKALEAEPAASGNKEYSINVSLNISPLLLFGAPHARIRVISKAFRENFSTLRRNTMR